MAAVPSNIRPDTHPPLPEQPTGIYIPSQGIPSPLNPQMSVTDVFRKTEKRPYKEEDFYAWLLDQARILRTYATIGSRIDWADLAEELEGMARNEERGLRSYLEVLLIHLLKWKYQPERRDRSWEVSVAKARAEIISRLEDSPSLKTKLTILTDKAYQTARKIAGLEMGWEKQKSKATLPTVCPWRDSEFMDEDFFPDGCPA